MKDATSDFVREQTTLLLDRLSRLTAEGPVFVGEVSQKHRTHPATVTRWMLRGVLAPGGRRVHLEHYRQGAKLVTSWAAVDRFLAALQSPTESDDVTPPRSPAAREKAAARANKDLADAGW